MIDLRLLGAIEARSSGLEGHSFKLTQPKRVALLAYLVLATPSGLHSRDRLLALLWPDADDSSSRHSLRNALHALRQVLGETAIETRGESWVGVDFGAVRCDVLEVRAHLEAGRLEEALVLCAGELMPGFHVSGAPEFDRWLEEQRLTVNRAIRTAAWKRSHELEGAGAQEVTALRRAVQLDPGNERGARRLMELLASGGDRGGAIRVYEEIVNWFAHELEAEPSRETRSLADRLRAGDAATPSTLIRTEVSRSTKPDLAAATLSATADAPLRKRRWPRVAIALGLLGSVALGGSLYLSRDDVRHGDPVAEAGVAALRLPARYRADTAIYSSYLRGLTLQFQFRFVESRDTLTSLVDRQPLYVPGLSALAHAWILTALNELTDPDEAWPKAGALARRALAIDSTAASAWLALAAEDAVLRQDLPRAGERIERARHFDPSDPEVAAASSAWFRHRGKMDSAVAEARLAHRLDPLSLGYERLVAKQLFFARRYQESLDAYTRLRLDEPESARGFADLARLCVAMGRTREALQWLRRARLAQGDSASAASLGEPATDAAAADVLAADSRRTVARLDRAARSGRRVPTMAYAAAFAALHDSSATLQWLDSMLVRRNGDVYQVRVDPAFDFLRGDARYRAWESRTGLPQLVP